LRGFCVDKPVIAGAENAYACSGYPAFNQGLLIFR
jgi:hypothetical protein